MVTRYNNTNEGIADTVLKTVIGVGKTAVSKTKQLVLKTAGAEQHTALNYAKANKKAAIDRFEAVKAQQYRANTPTYKEAEAVLKRANDAEREAMASVAKRNKEIITSYRNAKDKAAKMYGGTKTALKSAGKFVSDHPLITAAMTGAGVAAMDSDDEKKKNQANENVKQVASNIILEAINKKKLAKRGIRAGKYIAANVANTVIDKTVDKSVDVISKKISDRRNKNNEKH